MNVKLYVLLAAALIVLEGLTPVEDVPAGPSWDEWLPIS